MLLIGILEVTRMGSALPSQLKQEGIRELVPGRAPRNLVRLQKSELEAENLTQ